MQQENGTKSYFYSYDQNWGSKLVKQVKHTYKAFQGVLRPKKKEVFFDKPRTYKNGSTIENIFKDSKAKNLVGSLAPKEEALCLGTIDNVAIILYNLNTGGRAVGFAKYLGGIQNG